MSSSSKATRRHDDVLCQGALKETVESLDTEAITVSMQESAMWDAYLAEKNQLAQKPVEFPEAEEHPVEDAEEPVILSDSDEDTSKYNPGFSRFEVTGFGPAHLYPSKKRGQTSQKRRRKTDKKSDAGKIHGKLKGRSYPKMKMDGIPLSHKDFD